MHVALWVAQGWPAVVSLIAEVTKLAGSEAAHVRRPESWALPAALAAASACAAVGRSGPVG